ncbi:MAG TPA: serine hydrolase domain-containing protein [Actinomycetota bacterium]|nr:serine hydrolase domain-containing protein [Actinomycetota bacterium]
MSAAQVGGFCDGAFDAVREAFAENFDDGEIGAACAVEIDGRAVVDIWGGWADAQHSRPWREDTLVNAYSVGKPIVALAALQCVAAGSLHLDASAARWWPELVAAQRGATVRDLLCHRGGVPAIRRSLTNEALSDWQMMCEAIAETEPWWEPGTRHGYHVNTYGYLAGELARRVTGRLPGTWLRDEIAGPLEADLAWGLSPEQQARCADVVWQSDATPPHDWAALAGSLEQTMLALAYTNPPGFSSLGVVNTRAWREAQVPSTNLHATARGIARLYSALAMGGSLDGVTVLDGDLLAEATKPQSEGWCPFLDREVTFGLGFQPTRPNRPFGPNPESFGHFGTGGALGFADPNLRLSFGYVMNAVKPRWQNSRNRALIEALYGCL